MKKPTLRNSKPAPNGSIGFVDGTTKLTDKYRVRIMQESEEPVYPGPPPIHPSVLKIDVVVHRSYSIPLFNNDAVGKLRLALNGMQLKEVSNLIEVAKASGRDIAPFISNEWREAPRGSFHDDDLIQLSELCAFLPSGRFEGSGAPGASAFVVVSFAGYERAYPISRETAADLAASIADECQKADRTLKDPSSNSKARDAALMSLLIGGALLGTPGLAAAIIKGGPGMVGVALTGAIGTAILVFEAEDLARNSTDSALRDQALRDAEDARDRTRCRPDNSAKDVGTPPDRNHSPPRSGGGGGGRHFML